MQYQPFGRTGISVSSQCLGAMMFGAIGNPDHDECERIVHRALDAGINLIDTADVYSRGESEEIVGRALKGRRDDVLVATKCFNAMGRGPNRRGGSRHWIMQAVEGSLRRLGRDHIDLYQLHRRDVDADLDETLGALSDLVHQGKVRYIGGSSFEPDWIVESQWVSARQHLQRFVSEQPQYSMFARSIEGAVLPACVRHRMAVIVWSPLAGGWLTGKYRAEQPLPAGSRFGPDGFLAKARVQLAERGETRSVEPPSDTVEAARHELVERLASVADEAGMSLTNMALAFVNAHPAISATIIGPRTLEQLDGLLAAADISLDADTLDAIDRIVPPGSDAPGTDHFVVNPALDPAQRRRR